MGGVSSTTVGVGVEAGGPVNPAIGASRVGTGAALTSTGAGVGKGMDTGVGARQF